MLTVEVQPTVHFRLVRFYARLWRMNNVDGMLAPGAGAGASVEARMNYIGLVIAAWGMSAFACAPVMVALAYVGHLLRVPEVEDASVMLGLAGGFFCLAGMLNGFWCKHRAKQARREAQRRGDDSRQHQQALRRSLPTDRSLLFQAAAALTTGAVVASAAS